MKNKSTHEQYNENHRTNESENIERKCTKCHKWKMENEDNFYMMNKSKPEKGFMAECKKCRKKAQNNYTKNNLEKVLANNEEWKNQNREKNLAYMHNSFQRNIVYRKKYFKQWQQNNKYKLNQYNKQHNNHDITNQEWVSCKAYFNNSCAYCGLHIDDHYRTYAGKPQKIDLHKEHVEHKGKNDISNCIPSCLNCNSQKWEFLFDDWYNENNANYTKDRYNKIIKWLTEDYKKVIQNNNQ